MAKPRLIILIRHAQSEGNKNRDIHQTVPDHRVKLTPDGVNQARDAGRRLRKLLRPDDKIHFFTSPYRRTRETTEGILATLTSDDEEPSPFRRSNIKVYEEPRLREQDFGNFQPCSAEMERMWQERADYGHFFYRIPNGESAADAYDRVSGFNESLWRQFGEDDFASVCVLVTHGLMSRVFLMKWYHFTVEYFEDLRNVDHCEFLIMRKQDNGKYNLETKLRTWSELKRERAAAIKEKEKEKNKDKDSTQQQETKDGNSKDEVKLQRNKTFVVTRRWGGCPDGCNHTSKYTKRHDLESLRQKDIEQAAVSSHKSANAHHRHRAARLVISSDDEDVEHVHNHNHNHSHNSNSNSKNSHNSNNNNNSINSTNNNNINNTTSTGSGAASTPPSENKKQPLVEVTSTVTSTKTKTAALPHNSDDVLPPLTTVKSPQFVHLGRDFGGSYSGHTSVVDSDSDKPNYEHDDADDDSEATSHSKSRRNTAASIGANGPPPLHQRRRRGSILNSVEARLLQSTINSHNHARQLSVSSIGSSSAAGLSPGIGTFVNRLGDAPPHMHSDSEPDSVTMPPQRRVSVGTATSLSAMANVDDEKKHGVAEEGEIGTMEDIEAAEAADRSIEGSVY